MTFQSECSKTAKIWVWNFHLINQWNCTRAYGMPMTGQQGEDWRRQTGPRHPSLLLTRDSTLTVASRQWMPSSVPLKDNAGGIKRPSKILMPISIAAWNGFARDSQSTITVLIEKGFLQWHPSAKEIATPSWSIWIMAVQHHSVLNQHLPSLLYLYLLHCMFDSSCILHICIMHPCGLCCCQHYKNIFIYAAHSLWGLFAPIIFQFTNTFVVCAVAVPFSKNPINHRLIRNSSSKLKLMYLTHFNLMYLTHFNLFIFLNNDELPAYIYNNHSYQNEAHLTNACFVYSSAIKSDSIYFYFFEFVK